MSPAWPDQVTGDLLLRVDAIAHLEAGVFGEKCLRLLESPTLGVQAGIHHQPGSAKSLSLEHS